ncbi:glycoside hydrolase family 6 protein [Streptomyces profundus]|uniref:glycoside hydrolase family 6 protein n=1 Tax=Streptomyces profundus TaxID=2867410 RepID=UPI001D164AD9|nr:glycoside hydrolase family 6 protein [Streptomyces sp. MA3_2.13]UED88147.1 glycoside hydrolase family 6 protein [Streptomyces sp. MA3_2.13]
MSRTNSPPRRRRRALLTAGVLAVATLGTGSLAQGTASAADFACEVDYATNDWGSGFTANLTITNTGSTATNGWELTYAYAGNQTLSQGWNATWFQSGRTVTVSDTGWNGAIAPGASVSFGGNFTYSGTNAAPTSFAVNGVTCGEDGGPGPGPDPDPPGDRVDNPYQNAGVYVNPDWSANAAAEPGGSAIANEPTGVWLDRRAAIEGGSAGNSTGLREHLDNALVQAQDHENFVFQVVVYNLPGRDCAALASNGELAADDIDTYKDEFIDPIAEILGDPAYADLRIVTVIEIDSLPNLITNVSPRVTATPGCDEMLANGNYQAGIAYALQELGAIPNVYNYVDAGHYGWIGWDDNLGASAELFHDVAVDSGSVHNVHGFIVNTANYGPAVEPYYGIGDSVNGTSVRESSWIDWNRYVDNQSFAQGFRTELVSLGFDSGIGMLIDTSRSGWGGPDRPTGPGPQTDVDAYVEGSRVDQRFQAGNWCNQAGAGLGERPEVAPAAGIDAYVWIKPPGESDGSSEEIPNDEGKGFDEMCDPTYEGNPRNNHNMSGALGDAPISGHWFSAQFQELLANAYPPL